MMILQISNESDYEVIQDPYFGGATRKFAAMARVLPLLSDFVNRSEPELSLRDLHAMAGIQAEEKGGGCDDQLVSSENWARGSDPFSWQGNSKFCSHNWSWIL